MKSTLSCIARFGAICVLKATSRGMELGEGKFCTEDVQEVAGTFTAHNPRKDDDIPGCRMFIAKSFHQLIPLT